MITKHGSQDREPIADTDYKVSVVLSARHIVLVDTTDGHYELWAANDHYSGYVIEYGGVGYQFVRNYRDFAQQH